MIHFQVRGTDVRLAIDMRFVAGVSPKLEKCWYHPCVATYPAEITAQVVGQAMTDALAKEMQKIRKAAYDAGWKDAKAKTKKKTEFSTATHDSGYVGY